MNNIPTFDNMDEMVIAQVFVWTYVFISFCSGIWKWEPIRIATLKKVNNKVSKKK
jgi:hypothetical protein